MKCGTCGTEMREFWSKDGMKLMVCPHVGVEAVRTIAGVARWTELHCGAAVDGPYPTFVKLAWGGPTYEELRKATGETIPGAELLGLANSLMLAGVPADRLPGLMESAIALGLATAQEPKKAIETLSYGVRNKSPRRLDNIGVSHFDPSEAYGRYPELDQDLAWKLYACDMVEELAKRVKGSE